MKFSIRKKLIMSYAAIIFLMAGISMSFVSLFSEAYILSEAQTRLLQYSDRIAISLASKQTSFSIFYDFMWESVIREVSDNNYSIAIFDSHNELYAVSNFDMLDLKKETLVKYVQMRYGRNGGFVIPENRETYAAYSRVIKYSNGTPYATIVVLMQLDKYNIDGLLFILFFVSVMAASFIAVISAFLFSGQLTRNLKKLRKRADMLAKRQFDNTITINSKDEVGELAKSIDEMAKSIEEYDRSQKVFLQNASHELRTPLMSIRGYVEGLRDGIFTDNADAVYDSILNQTSRLEKLVEDVMYLSKIETTKDIMVMSSVNTLEIIDEAIERVEGIASANDISLVKGDILIADIVGDGDHLATVFTNLFSNSLRFAKEKIFVEAVPVEKGVIVTVTDDGPGFSEDDLPHIFDRFYKGKKGKHGLGLAIAKAVVTAHKGTISAYNRTDGQQGAVFEVFLPINKK